MQSEAGQVTVLLRKLRAGEGDARDRLAELVYSELRRIAAGRLSHEYGHRTLTPTELAHEAWLRLHDDAAGAENRDHFFAIAATAMRRLLIDRARARRAHKRPRAGVPLDDVDLAAPSADEQLIALNDALDRLLQINARAARVTELRYFAGMTHTQIAAVLNLDRRTVDRDWAFAKAWLFQEVRGAAPADPR